jgi:CelD/BcsL family acetyltransferase involved in cellulose biosynthesis
LKVVQISFREFLGFRKTWNDALGRSIDNNIFLTWEWLSSWWRVFGNGKYFHLIAVFDGEKLLAAAPLMSSSYNVSGLKLRKLECINSHSSDYCTFLLTEKPLEQARIMIEYAADKLSDWDSIEFRQVPAYSNTAQFLSLPEEKFTFKRRIRDVCPYSPLPNQFEDYLATLDGKFRRELRRDERKLKEGNKVEFRICSNPTDVKEGMKAFIDLHERRWLSKKALGGVFSDKEFKDFHLEVASLLAERGWLTLSFTLVNDVPVAGVYGFTYGRKFYAYLSGFEPSYGKYAVGDLHWMYLIEHCIKNNLRELDFMRGAEAYKKKWNTKERRNVEFWTAKRQFVPLVYNLITKNDHFAFLSRGKFLHQSS